MDKYIENKALLNALKEERKKGNFVFTSKWIKEIMDNLPAADVVEVVRCKDCEHCVHAVENGRACLWKAEHEDEEESCLGRHFEYNGMVGDD